MKVCHVTSAHNRYDGRIFYKQLSSLAKKYECFLLCCDELEDEIKNNVKIMSTHKKFKNRYERFLKSNNMLKKKCLEIDADVYEFHDSDLLNLALYMKKKGKKVIFDAHEDYEALFLEREWIPKFLRQFLLKNYIKKERKVLPELDYIICAAKHIKNKIKKYNKNVEIIENFPILLPYNKKENHNKKEDIICFAGSIRSDWNHENIINSIRDIKDVKYVIAGNYTNEYYKELSLIDGFNKVNFIGKIKREEVDNLYNKSKIGMAICSYLPNTDYKNGSLGNTKIFEYMMNGLPVIFTNYNEYLKINEEKKFGIPVKPSDVSEITNAIKYLLDNPKQADDMGKNGRLLVEKKYNWSILEKRLYDIYNKIEKK